MSATYAELLSVIHLGIARNMYEFCSIHFNVALNTSIPHEYLRSY